VTITPLLLVILVLTLLYLWRRHQFDVVKPPTSMSLPQEVGK
jgi:hypothetical protein